MVAERSNDSKEYNVDEIQMRILNGDGAAWIKYGIDDTVHYQLDPFHKHKAILRSVKVEEQRKVILKLLSDNKIDEALTYIAGLSNDTDDEKEQKKLKDLYVYFKENRNGLIPYQERGLDIPKDKTYEIIQILSASKAPKNRCPEGAGVPMSIESWNKCDLIGTNIHGKICMKKDCQYLFDSN